MQKPVFSRRGSNYYVCIHAYEIFYNFTYSSNYDKKSVIFFFCFSSSFSLSLFFLAQNIVCGFIQNLFVGTYEQNGITLKTSFYYLSVLFDGSK